MASAVPRSVRLGQRRRPNRVLTCWTNRVIGIMIAVQTKSWEVAEICKTRLVSRLHSRCNRPQFMESFQLSQRGGGCPKSILLSKITIGRPAYVSPQATSFTPNRCKIGRQEAFKLASFALVPVLSFPEETRRPPKRGLAAC